MPYIWAKKFGKLDELPISTSNMFYPAGLTLSRKEKLSIIWLAANYDPEKYKKIIPPKECEKANIERVCNAIMNPTVPFALRLSAQLLLGTVRVYRTKTKLILEMAEQMIVKLSTLISETCTRTYDMPVAMLRADAITIADTGMSIIDYSLEPVYYDPQMIMHMNEEDFITVNGTPLQSPIKIEKKSHTKKSMVTPTKSPLIVSNSKISFQEDLLSPSRPIQVPPGDEDFGVLGFGPAQDNFLTDLMEIADINFRPKTLDFGPDDEEEPPVRLEPVLEDDENLLDVVPLDQAQKKAELAETATASDLPKPTTTDDTQDAKVIIKKTEEEDKKVLTELATILPSLPSDAHSRKRKMEDMEEDSKSMASDTAGQVADLDQLLRDAVEINENLKSSIQDDVFGKTSEEFGKVEELHRGTEEDVVEKPEDLPKEVGEEAVEPVEPAIVIEPVGDKSIVRSQSESSVNGVPGVPMDWESNLRTPAEVIILKPLPSQPKKKRKLMVDKEIFIESKEMKNNFATPQKLVRMPMIAGSAFPSGKDMFTLPIKENNIPRLKFWWENNTILEEGDPISVILPQDILPEVEYEQPPSVGPPSVGPTEMIIDEPMEEDMVEEKEVPTGEKEAEPVITPVEERVILPDEAPPKSPEPTTGSRYDETPSSIDILRAGSGSLKSFEQSAGSNIAFNQTPVGEASKSLIDNINVDDVMLTGPPQSPRISGIGLLPPDIEVYLDEVPELDVVLEQDEKSIDFVADMAEDDDLLNQNYKAFQRTIFHSLKTSDKTVFQRLFPSSRTKKRDAALALYLTLNMHKNGYVELQQTELFGDIYIHKGRIS